MSEEQIIEVAKIIEEWNPLGEKANTIESLEGYRYEAMDIISSYKIFSKKQNIKETIKNVLTQAFNIELNEVKLSEVAEEIELILHVKK